MSDSQTSEVSQHKWCHSLHTRRTKLFATKFLGMSLQGILRHHTLSNVVWCFRRLHKGHKKFKGAAQILKMVQTRYDNHGRYYLMKWFQYAHNPAKIDPISFASVRFLVSQEDKKRYFSKWRAAFLHKKIVDTAYKASASKFANLANKFALRH